ncbi:protein-tyrosine sulfotransferase-like [Rhodamnia argentea]|uniref:Protein-tyrosine sulfotransferase-like n=1 Tax=Rhodamnia argentea TaxID=178133 RepID=A0A8B8QGM2_9MYRT|nr:protein-tyrosine sulfotransferase-like [Rhodamnia argentea]
MRLMDPTPSLRFAILLILLGLTNAFPQKRDFGHCESVVKRWTSSAPSLEVKADNHALRDLLFFLHVPRTGGRTYFHCFLHKLYSGALECPRSYDKLNFDPSKRKCSLLVSHDDYSLVSKLPKDRTSVVTILRDPIDRVFSTYELSVELATEFLAYPNLTSATTTAGSLSSKTSTLDIWPWKYLVPWMKEDLFARRDARRRGSRDTYSSDPYNMEDIVIPLHKFIKDPISQDIIHNGATFQVAGLTNNSYFPESREVRHCVTQHKVLGQHVLEVAKRRLDNMLYVGLTEDHKKSATMFADVVGAQAISQLKGSSSGVETASTNESEQSSLSDSKSDDDQSQNVPPDVEVSAVGKDGASNKNMTEGELKESYESCVSSFSDAQSHRHISALKKISPVNFTKESRRQVPEAVLQEIKSLNNLDVELYEYAKEIFAQQNRRTTEKSTLTEKFGSMISSAYGTSQRSRLFVFLPVILLLISCILSVNARRRTSKVKI